MTTNEARQLRQPRQPRQRLAAAWARIRAYLKPPRRLHFTRSGWLLTFAIVALGFATLNTGNNLLYLVLGGLLGLIMLSGWLSELSISRIRIVRRLPRAIIAREPTRLTYEVTNLKNRFPSVSLELEEAGIGACAFLVAAWPGKVGMARGQFRAERRGVFQLGRLTIRTSFPFGLFIKERDVETTATLLVWPRTDRVVRDPVRAGERARKLGLTTPIGAGGGRGEYRTLRPYLPGDDPRDVHWRSTARSGHPVVREYERDATDTLWLCLDLRAPPGEEAENAIEIAAALAARAEEVNERFGLATNDAVIDPGQGPGQLEAILDALARAQFREDAPALVPPVAAAECVLVRATGAADPRFSDTFTGAVA